MLILQCVCAFALIFWASSRKSYLLYGIWGLRVICLLSDEIQGPRKKPKLLPRRGIDENSKEVRLLSGSLLFLLTPFPPFLLGLFLLIYIWLHGGMQFRRQLRSIAVDGKDILAAARDASQRSLARLEAKEATAKEKAKREEARIAELKRIRGERWLPSMAREMQVKSQVWKSWSYAHFQSSNLFLPFSFSCSVKQKIWATSIGQTLEAV